MTDTAPLAGRPCWIDLFTVDVDVAIAFYTELFGWSVGEASTEFGGYRMFFQEDRPIAGLMPSDGTQGPNAWSVYLETADIAATTEKARTAGASVIVEPMPIADLGSMAMYADPTGAAVGAWQPGSFPGFQLRGEVGSPVWFENLTTDYETAVSFYTDVFGWQTHVMSDAADFRYTTLGRDEAAAAGIMDATGYLAGSPSRWQFYLAVADTDQAIAAAVSLGGTVVEEAQESPYGRLAALEDPGGVRIAIMGPARTQG